MFFRVLAGFSFLHVQMIAKFTATHSNPQTDTTLCFQLFDDVFPRNPGLQGISGINLWAINRKGMFDVVRNIAMICSKHVRW